MPPTTPVPVRICAVSWDPEAAARAWLIRHLVQTYRPRDMTALGAGEGASGSCGHRLLDEMDREDHPGFTSRAGQALRRSRSRHAARRHAGEPRPRPRSGMLPVELVTGCTPR